MTTKEPLESLREHGREEGSKDHMNLPGRATKIDDKTYQWEPAETLAIDLSKFHPQASK
jgi:hypothetical protein